MSKTEARISFSIDRLTDRLFKKIVKDETKKGNGNRSAIFRAMVITEAEKRGLK